MKSTHSIIYQVNLLLANQPNIAISLKSSDQLIRATNTNYMPVNLVKQIEAIPLAKWFLCSFQKRLTYKPRCFIQYLLLFILIILLLTLTHSRMSRKQMNFLFKIIIDAKTCNVRSLAKTNPSNAPSPKWSQRPVLPIYHFYEKKIVIFGTPQCSD